MTLAEMRRILDRRDLQLTKSLGQNFLHDANQLQRIVDAGALQPADHILEVGPGLGPLTSLLIARGNPVLAIETDARLVDFLRHEFPAASNLTLLHEDALAWLRSEVRDWTHWKLVANLPYSVASPILVELALSDRPPERMVATLQQEVARRLMAGPDDDDYGVLTLLIQWRFKATRMFKIPRPCFFPEPAVDSACVTLERRPETPGSAELRAAYVRVVKNALSQRRKMMHKLLRQQWPAEAVTGAMTATGLDAGIRGEKLSRDQFIQLTQELIARRAATPPATQIATPNPDPS